MNGIRLTGKKEASLLHGAIRRPKTPPARVRIPFDQGCGEKPVTCVEPGQHVCVGEAIAVPGGHLSTALHASISGTVKSIGTFPHPLLGESEAVEIESDGHDKPARDIGRQRAGWQDLSRRELADLFQEHGITGPGKKPVPVHAACRALREKGAGVLVINACESEPYLTSDRALLSAHTLETLKGSELLRKAFQAEKIVFVLEDNNLETVELLRSKIYFLKWDFCEVAVFPALYPRSDETLLKTQFSGRSGRTVVLGPDTAFAVYEAVVLQKPFYERVVTVSGECVIEPCNVWGRIGESFGDVLKVCRGLMREPGKLLMGGPMSGEAQAGADVPVLKSTRAVLALPKEIVREAKTEPCIRCGRCLEVCPAGISPAMITLAAERSLGRDALDWGLEACIECGNCTYICPSKIPMAELIRKAFVLTGLRREAKTCS